MLSEKRAQKFHTDDVSLPRSRQYFGRAAWEIWFNQSETLPRSGLWHAISMLFLHSFLRRLLAGKPVLASPNVSCFLRLCISMLKEVYAPCKGIQGGLGFCIPRRGFRILSTGFQSLSVELEFWIPNTYFVFRFPESRIPDTKSKIFSDSNWSKNFLDSLT